MIDKIIKIYLLYINRKYLMMFIKYFFIQRKTTIKWGKNGSRNDGHFRWGVNDDRNGSRFSPFSSRLQAGLYDLGINLLSIDQGRIREVKYSEF